MTQVSSTDSLTLALWNAVCGSGAVDSARMLMRIKALGMADTCSRCCGSGLYGPSCVEAGRCFKCGGGGVLMPKITQRLIDDVAAAVAGGGLVSYFDYHKRMRVARRAADRAREAWQGTRVSKAYDWLAASRGSAYDLQIADDVNEPLYRTYDAISKLCSDLRGAKDEATQMTLCAQIEELMTQMHALADAAPALIDSIRLQHGLQPVEKAP